MPTIKIEYVFCKLKTIEYYLVHFADGGDGGIYVMSSRWGEL